MSFTDFSDWLSPWFLTSLDFCNVKETSLSYTKGNFCSKENDYHLLLDHGYHAASKTFFFPDGVSTSARKKLCFTAVHSEKMEKGTFQLFEKSGVLVVFFKRESLIFSSKITTIFWPLPLALLPFLFKNSRYQSEQKQA